MNKSFITLMAFCSLSASVVAKTNISIATQTMQLVLQVKDNGRLYQTYLGERLSTATPLDHLAMPYITPTSSNVAGYEVYPVMGTEDYYEPAFEICHADGNPTSVFQYVTHEQHAAENGTIETIIRLKDTVYPVHLTLHYVAYPKENIIRQWSEISHQEKKPVQISRYASSMLYFENSCYYLNEFGSD